MKTIKPYSYTQSSRTLWSMLIGMFLFSLAVFFWFVDSTFFNMLSLGIFVLFCSVCYAFVKNEKWIFIIEDNAIKWDYPRLPKSKGAIEIEGVSKITVNECNSDLLIRMNNSTEIRLKFVGYGFSIYEYLKENYQIEIVYIEDDA